MAMAYKVLEKLILLLYSSSKFMGFVSFSILLWTI